MENKQIYKAIVNVMGEIGAIGKDRKNQQQGFMYRGVEDVMNTLQPLLKKHGVFIVPEVLEHTREERQTKSGGNLIYSVMKIRHHFYAEDGSEVVSTTIGEGMDSADKSSNKALAIAFKYACFQVFCIPTEEMDDPDGDTPPESKRGENPAKKETSQNQGKNAPKTNEKTKAVQPITKSELVQKYGFNEPEKAVLWLEEQVGKKLASFSEEELAWSREQLAIIKRKKEEKAKRERAIMDGADDVPFPMED